MVDDLYTLVLTMMTGDVQATLRWLNNPKSYFDGNTPVELYASSELGSKRVMQAIEDLSSRPPKIDEEFGYRTEVK